MQTRLWIVLAICILFPSICRSESCPWLNAATAGGLLGGEVTMKVIHSSPADTTCEFTLKRDTSISTLQIAVHTMSAVNREFQQYLAQCGAGALPLRAVGNEAVECMQSADANHATKSEQIISRVRERAFVLTWTMPKSDLEASSQAQDDIRERFRNVAEQVAGSLF